MTALTISMHAIERYQERVANVPAEEVVARLNSPAIRLAASFGARFVRLGTGHRVAIVNHTVTTILPPEHFGKQIKRVGLGRFGRSIDQRKERSNHD